MRRWSWQVSDDFCGIHFSDWRALTPAQRSALTIALMRRAHAARSRAIRRALLGALAGLFGRPKRLLVPAATPTSVRH
jgi:hypothetical protein